MDKKTPKVIYSIGARIAGGGIGNTSYYAVREVFRAGLLKKLLCSSYDSDRCEIPPSLIKPTPLIDSYWPQIPIAKKLRDVNWIKDNFYDFLATRFVDKCDIFHGWSHFSLLQLKKAQKLGAKIILDRASSHISTQKEILGSAVGWLTERKELEEYRRADLILVSSKFAYQSFLEQGIDEAKLRLIPFGVDLARFKPAAESSGGDSGEVKFLFVGQIGARKGVPLLLKAWEKLNLKRAKLVLVGPPAGVTKGSVEFTGFTDPLPHYQSADVFVFPSLEEGSALVTYEAMAAGLPQIVTFESGSLVEDGKEGLFVESGNVNDLAGKIEYLYQHPEVRERMGQAGLKKIRDYPWGRYGRRVVEAYGL